MDRLSLSPPETATGGPAERPKRRHKKESPHLILVIYADDQWTGYQL